MKTILSVMLILLAYTQHSFSEDYNFNTFKVVNPYLLNTITRSASKGVITIPQMDEPSLFNRIQTEFEKNYEEISKRLASRVIGDQDGFHVGLNNLGYTYNHDFLDFTVTLSRTLAPDILNLERWIVSDEFIVNIDATKLLSNLQSSGAISITKKQLGYYAGLVFKRSYRFVHFSDTYMEGLTLEADKLFLMFKHFTNKTYLSLEEFEFIQKEDSLSINAGLLATAPLGNGLGLGLGAVAKYRRLAKMDLQRIGRGEEVVPGEYLRVSYSKEKLVSVGVAAVIEADFLKLLKISLLTLEFEYTREEKQKTNLRFLQKHKDELEKDSYLSRNVERLLKGKKVDNYFLKPYIVSHENRVTETKNLKYNILFFGGAQEQRTENIEVVKDNKVDVFYKHNYKKVKYKQDIVSRFVSIIFNSFLKMKAVVNTNASDTKKVSIEYKSDDDLVKHMKKLNISGNKEKVSISLNRDFYSKNVSGFGKSKYKKYALRLLDRTEGIDKKIGQMLKSDQLIGPLRYNADFEIGKLGIDYLHKRNAQSVYKDIRSVCSKKWYSLGNLIGGCKRKLTRSYEKYLYDWAHYKVTYKSYKRCAKVAKKRKWRSRRTRRLQRKCMGLLSQKTDLSTNYDIPLWRFKDLVQNVHVFSKDHHNFYNLFGRENLFIHGSFKARTNQGANFSVYFKSGKFKGLGVVDTYMRARGMRSPASILD